MAFVIHDLQGLEAKKFKGKFLVKTMDFIHQ